MRTSLTLILTAVLVVATAAGTEAQDLKAGVDAWVLSHQRAIVGELVSLLSIPNAAADRAGISRNVEALRQMLAGRGFRRREPRHQGQSAGVRHACRARRHADPALLRPLRRQPVDPKGWKQADPFTPILRDGRLESGAREVTDLAARDRFQPDWRIYARSSSDDKSPVVALLAAIDALKSMGRAPTSNIHVVLDGEEETGSPSMLAAIAQYRDKLRADAMIILDGPVHPSGRPTVNFGARGILTMELTVFRAEVRPAQRPLRQLGPQSGVRAGAAARVDEGRPRSSAGAGLLRRSRAAGA